MSEKRLRILLVGASGTLGRAVAAELGQRHEVMAAGRSSGSADSRSSIKASAVWIRVSRSALLVGGAGEAREDAGGSRLRAGIRCD